MNSFNELIDDKLLVTNVTKNETQSFCAVSFLTPPNLLKKSIINSINNIFLNFNGELKDITDNVCNSLLNKFKDKIESKIKLYNKNVMFKKYVPLLEYIDNKIYNHDTDTDPSNLSLSPSLIQTFNTQSYRFFKDDSDELDFLFELYKSKNYKELNNSYVSLHGDEVNTRCFKVKQVFNNNTDAVSISKTYGDNTANIYVVPIGKWIPWNVTTINKLNYKITDDMLVTLNRLMKDHNENIKKLNKEFKDRVKESKGES
jgi:hypothetical protein